ncbi:DNA-binding protein [bacterium]|nr:MAG: DNA-binding protein [bacterium]
MPSIKPKNKEIMNTLEVAEFLKLHPYTVNKLAREGKIPAFKIGADWRFHKKHIERWINEKIAYSQQGRERRKPGKDGKDSGPEPTLI